MVMLIAGRTTSRCWQCLGFRVPVSDVPHRGKDGRFFKAGYLTTVAITKCVKNTAGQLGQFI